MSNPRHLMEPRQQPVRVSYEPPIPLRSSDFDAVAPFRPTATSAPAAAPSPTETSDQLFLAHS